MERLPQLAHGDFLRARGSRAVTEAGVGEAEAKRKLRCVLLIDVARNVFRLALFRRMVGIAGGTARVELVVVERLLPDRTRPAEREMSGGRRFAKQQVG